MSDDPRVARMRELSAEYEYQQLPRDIRDDYIDVLLTAIIQMGETIRLLYREHP